MPEIRISQSSLQNEPSPGAIQAAPPPSPAESSAIRKFLLGRGNSAIADRGFHWLMVLCALSIFAIVVLIASELVRGSHLTWAQSGFKFFYTSFVDPDSKSPLYWDPVNGHFSALPFIYGTLVSSFLALLLAVPLAIGVAVFLTEMCPRVLRGPLAFLTELLAAIPSVIYGLWAVFVLVPLMREHVNPPLVKFLGWTGFFNDDNPTGLGFVAAGVILAIMILPIISSLTREVMNAVPGSQREAVLALGATRWEMIRWASCATRASASSAPSSSASAAPSAKPWPSPWSSETPRKSSAPCSPAELPWPRSSLMNMLRPPAICTSALSLKSDSPSSSSPLSLTPSLACSSGP